MISVKSRVFLLIAALSISGSGLSMAQSDGNATTGSDFNLFEVVDHTKQSSSSNDQTVIQQSGSNSSSGVVKNQSSPPSTANGGTGLSGSVRPRKVAQKPIIVPTPGVTVTSKPLPGAAIVPPTPGPQDTSLFADLTGKTPRRSGTAFLRVRVAVPHNKDCVDTFTAYPYHVKPPIVKFNEDLPTDFEVVKANIVNSGYLDRQSGRKPRPTFGWRWVKAYETGLKKSHMGVPHTMATYYQWASQMVKWVIPEVRLSNAIEAERFQRYQQALRDYDEKRTDSEMAATRDGLFPVKMRRRMNIISDCSLPPGTWWVVGTHKIGALTYYWNIPVNVQPSSVTNVVLTEDTAMIIQGAAW